MLQIILGINSTVYTHFIYISVGIAVIRCGYYQVLSVFKMKCRLLEQRSTQNILIRTGTYRIEP